ncbi:MAG: Hsp20/alpha crystallin family protein [Alphaproteobacteria bacterium]|nr:Hsp20/alpha crystallin family protein [Alphaproteobacteria bacterium]
MSTRQLEAMMWAEACEAMERAERLQRQFFHRAPAAPHWEAPVDVYETGDSVIIVIAMPGVELDSIKVGLSGGVLSVDGDRQLPPDLREARILRMEIPHGHFQRRIELPPEPLELSGRHLANGCLMLRLRRL